MKNVTAMQRLWKNYSGILPPTRVTIARLHDKCEEDGTV
jgi:hypothetical protein